MVDYIHISDFTEMDRDILLEYLWDFSTQIDNEYDIFDIQNAKNQIVIDNGYADNICGRIIELYLYSSDTISPYLYDFHNGVGSVQEFVNCIREKKKLIFDTNTIYLLTSNIQTMNL